jgi:hypothetical protein
VNSETGSLSLQRRSTPVQTYARIAGVLLLLSLCAGFLGEIVVPMTLIVPGDAARTASNIVGAETLFRAGFALYLVEALCDVALALVFYALLYPVQQHLALLSAFFGVMSTALFGVAELFYFAPLLLLSGRGYLNTFSPDQLKTLALLSLGLYTYAAGIFAVFYGAASALRGYLIYRSGFLPKTLGLLLMLAGIGFIAKNFALVLAPAYASNAFLLPMVVAGASLTVWLLVKGVDVARWEAIAARAAA